MRNNTTGGIRTQLMFIAALAAVLALPVASAQLGTSVRIGDQAAVDADAELATGDTADVIGGATDGATERLGKTATKTGGGLRDTLEPAAEAPRFRIHTRIDAGMVGQLVTGALEVPEVRDMLGGKTRLDVVVGTQHFQVDIANGALTSVRATTSVPDADYTIRAAGDAARSLANAADPAYTAVRLLKDHYLTVEAQKLAHQAALKAMFSGLLDSRLDVQDGLEDVELGADATAAEQAIKASGLRIVRVEGRLYAANELGGIVAALHDGSRALGDPPAALGVRLSGIAGGSTVDRAHLGALFGADPAAHALRQTLGERAPLVGPAAELVDPTRTAALQRAGAPDAFLAGLGATELARAQLSELAAGAS